MSENKQIVKNASKGYGYTYSNLADLAKAGIEIPPMKTQKVGEDEYVFALIDGEWLQGAKVVEMEMKGMNQAQAYGSALTYARRYTVQLVKAIACDDDNAIEQDGANRKQAQAKPQQTNSANRLDFNSIRDTIAMIDDLESLTAHYNKTIKQHKLSDKQLEAVKRIYADRREDIQG